jgi:hypothetical protein
LDGLPILDSPTRDSDEPSFASETSSHDDTWGSWKDAESQTPIDWDSGSQFHLAQEASLSGEGDSFDIIDDNFVEIVFEKRNLGSGGTNLISDFNSQTHTHKCFAFY